MKKTILTSALLAAIFLSPLLSLLPSPFGEGLGVRRGEASAQVSCAVTQANTSNVFANTTNNEVIGITVTTGAAATKDYFSVVAFLSGKCFLRDMINIPTTKIIIASPKTARYIYSPIIV